LKKSQADVALVFDYDTMWMGDVQPQGKDYNALELVFRLYSTLRGLGLDVDIISSQNDLSKYRVIVIAAQWHVEPALQIQLEQSKAHILIAPRAGSKSQYLSISEPLPPGSLTTLIGAKVLRAGSLPPSISLPIFATNSSVVITHASRWVEDLRCIDAKPFWMTTKGSPVVTRKDNVTYVGAWLADDGWQKLLINVCALAGVETTQLPQGLRLSRLGKVVLAANFSDQVISWQPKQEAIAAKQQSIRILLGEEKIPPQGIAIWQVC
jgi:beta-galactosidase